jgi:hypothetical protein
MTSWATITVGIDTDSKNFTGPPTGLRIDKGNDEYGWVDDERLYALSYGRYQKGRYKKHVKNFDSPWFNGARTAVICDVEDTGDTVDSLVYRSAQLEDGPRIDGLYHDVTYSGSRFPEEERESFVDRVEESAGVRPVVEPIETTTPPDMMVSVER